MANPRNVALNVLLKIEQEQAYSNLALSNAIRESRLSGVDSAFVSALVYGVLERQITLDYIIKQYSKIPLRKIETKTKEGEEAQGDANSVKTEDKEVIEKPQPTENIKFGFGFF